MILDSGQPPSPVRQDRTSVLNRTIPAFLDAEAGLPCTARQRPLSCEAWE